MNKTATLPHGGRRATLFILGCIGRYWKFPTNSGRQFVNTIVFKAITAVFCAVPFQRKRVKTMAVYHVLQAYIISKQQIFIVNGHHEKDDINPAPSAAHIKKHTI